MIPRPQIFISAVSKELRSARQLIANTLQFLGYAPVWQDVFGVEPGELPAMLRKKIDECQGVVHLVGQCYGAEPPAPDKRFGRVSYTQYEALYARQRGKKVWCFVLDEGFPADEHEAEPEELRALQLAYRQRMKADAHLFHPVATPDGLKAKVHEIREELAALRRRFTVWAAGVLSLLVAIVCLAVWLLIVVRSPQAMTEERANAAFVAKDYPAAFDAYSRLSDADPANPAYHRRIEECARAGRLEKAFFERYLALVRREPDTAVFHNYLGNAFLMLDRQDKDGKAREHYETAARLDPNLPAPLANLAILAHRAGKSQEAEGLFRRYLAVEPRDAQCWVNLGLLHIARVRASATTDTIEAANAENALRAALEIEPGSSAAYKGLGQLCVAVGRKNDAFEAYQRSYALDDAQPDVRQQIELLAWESDGVRVADPEADDMKTRGRTGEDAAKRAAAMPIAVVVMQMLDLGQLEQAEAACIEWTRAEPENPLAWRLLARAYDGQGRADDANRAFARVDAILKREQGDSDR